MSIPWVEKYRPSNMDNIVLDPINRTFFNNILAKKHFPNLLFYGPPGTGKTTTIISLINKYFGIMGENSQGMVLHLNASDDRGIDVIRNQINQFVNANSIFHNSIKFVILDEVDYMTKNAQHALRQLLNSSQLLSVRFCLICNYISKIETSLRNEFISIRFNQLPDTAINNFIQNIEVCEGLDLGIEKREMIQKRFHSDIRSMINFLQINQHELKISCDILNKSVFDKIKNSIKNDTIADYTNFMYQLSIQYNLNETEIIKDFFFYVIRNEKPSSEFIGFIETVIHSNYFTELIVYTKLAAQFL